MPRPVKKKVDKTGLGRTLIKKQQARKNRALDSEVSKLISLVVVVFIIV